jgi:hypothetical protein
VRGWSEQKFRERVAARAAELGETVNALMERAGLGEQFRRTPRSGRRIDTLEKIAQTLNWTLAEVMGFVEPIDIDLLLRAHQSAQRVYAALRIAARTERVLISAQAYIYSELVECRQSGVEVDDEHLAACERMLIRSAESSGLGAAPENTTTSKR